MSDVAGFMARDPSCTVGTRLGQISFVNSLPVTLPIKCGWVSGCCEIQEGTPSKMNAALASGLLDVAAVSSHYFVSSCDLDLVPDLSISSCGAVGSVLLFSRVEPSALSKLRVAVPLASATSVNLLRVLMLESYGADVSLTPVARPVIDQQFEAALVIGDYALTVDSQWSSHYWRKDLGKWWHDSTALPMVFGVWAARRAFATERPGAYRALCETLTAARDLGLTQHLSSVLDLASSRTGLSRQRLHRYYLDELDFTLSDKHLKGLEYFRLLCGKRGLLSGAASRSTI